MRSRVEVVARKSDHICVVRDVPDARGNWYSSAQRSHHSQSSLRQDSSERAPQAPTSAAATAAGQPKTGGHEEPAGAAQAAPAKPSLAALLGRKHPVIKEEPTTPGGSLLASETPPPGAKRPPLKLQTASAAAALSTGQQQVLAAGQVQQAPGTHEQQLSRQIISLLEEMKHDLKTDIAQLARRVDSIDTSVHMASQTACKFNPSASLAPATHQPQPPIQPAAKAAPERRDTSGAQASRGASQQQASSSSRSPSRERERSRSPSSSGAAKRHRHHHHHHHHHHRKASHSTPTATPSSSQVDISGAQTGATGGQRQQQHLQVGASQPSTGQQKDTLQAGPTIGQQPQPRVPSSFEQSDDDQDATSKL